MRGVATSAVLAAVMATGACRGAPQQASDFAIAGSDLAEMPRGIAYVLAAEFELKEALYELNFSTGRARLVAGAGSNVNELAASKADVLVAARPYSVFDPVLLYRVTPDGLQPIPGLDVGQADAPVVSDTGRVAFSSDLSPDTISTWDGPGSGPVEQIKGFLLTPVWLQDGRLAVVDTPERTGRSRLHILFGRKRDVRALPVRAASIVWDGGKYIAMRYRFPITTSDAPGNRTPTAGRAYILDARTLKVVSTIEKWRPLGWAGEDLIMTFDARFGILSPPYKRVTPLDVYGPDLIWDAAWVSAA